MADRADRAPALPGRAGDHRYAPRPWRLHRRGAAGGDQIRQGGPRPSRDPALQLPPRRGHVRGPADHLHPCARGQRTHGNHRPTLGAPTVRSPPMSRAERLLDLIQILRRHRQPVSGQALADELDISLRTLYRDIASLQGQGAGIAGEAGVGYILKPGFMLPPLMFSEEEIEALVLGSRWVAKRGDTRLGAAAENALAKIAAVLPEDLREQLDASALLVGVGEAIAAGDAELATIREAIRRER